MADAEAVITEYCRGFDGDTLIVFKNHDHIYEITAAVECAKTELLARFRDNRLKTIEGVYKFEGPAADIIADIGKMRANGSTVDPFDTAITYARRTGNLKKCVVKTVTVVDFDQGALNLLSAHAAKIAALEKTLKERETRLDEISKLVAAVKIAAENETTKV